MLTVPANNSKTCWAIQEKKVNAGDFLVFVLTTMARYLIRSKYKYFVDYVQQVFHILEIRTTNMKYHIQKHHPEHLKDIGEGSSKERDTDAASSESGFKQLSLQTTLNKVKSYSTDSQRHKTMVNAVGEFICYGLQPISVADNPSSRKLLGKSDPKFQLPSRKYFSHHVSC